MELRWIKKRDGTRTLQYLDRAWPVKWVDLPEVTEQEALDEDEEQKKRQEDTEKNIRHGLMGKTYTVG